MKPMHGKKKNSRLVILISYYVKGRPMSVVVSAKVPKELRERARRYGISISKVVRRTLEAEVAKAEEEKLIYCKDSVSLALKMAEFISPVIRSLQREAETNSELFWAKEAEKLHWFQKWQRVFEWEPPRFRWFSGGLTNLSYNCLDRHVQNGWGGHAALVAENERGERRVYTYSQLLHSVKRVAVALRGM